MVANLALVANLAVVASLAGEANGNGVANLAGELDEEWFVYLAMIANLETHYPQHLFFFPVLACSCHWGRGFMIQGWQICNLLSPYAVGLVEVY